MDEAVENNSYESEKKLNNQELSANQTAIDNVKENLTENITNNPNRSEEIDQTFNGTTKELMNFTSEVDYEMALNQTEISDFLENTVDNEANSDVFLNETIELNTTLNKDNQGNNFNSEYWEQNKNIESNSSFENDNITQNFTENIINDHNISEVSDQLFNYTIDESMNTLKNNSDQNVTDIIDSSYLKENLTQNETQPDEIMESLTTLHYMISTLEKLKKEKTSKSELIKKFINQFIIILKFSLFD